MGTAALGCNEGAVRLYEKLGLQQEDVRREYIWHDGRFCDEVRFGMLEEVWKEMQERPGSEER